MATTNKFEVDPGPEWPSLHVQIVDHDPSWALRFATERDLLVGAIPSLVGALHHFGSTAVRGLAAKPIVDIALEVSCAISDVPAEALQALRAIGYVHRRRTHREDMLFLGKGEGHEVHLQVFEQGNAEVARLVRLRDYLRAHPDEVAAYGTLKRMLAERHEGSARFYAKDKYLELVGYNDRAQQWEEVNQK